MTMVSIIIACYNSKDFISHAIDSILQQTFSDWEIIVVDDCSTDESALIVKRYCGRNERIRYFKTDFPSGSPALPRNIGIANARGRYIAFLDSDDMWLPDKLKEQLHLFDDDKTAIAYSNYEKMTEIGQRENRIIKAPSTVNYKQLLLGNVIGCLTAIYDTHKVGKIYFSENSHEDYILWLSILKNGFIARNSNTVTALYRVRNHSVSSNKLKALSWQWNIYVNIERTGYFKAAYYFIHYAYRAFAKMLK